MVGTHQRSEEACSDEVGTESSATTESQFESIDQERTELSIVNEHVVPAHRNWLKTKELPRHVQLLGSLFASLEENQVTAWLEHDEELSQYLLLRLPRRKVDQESLADDGVVFAKSEDILGRTSTSSLGVIEHVDRVELHVAKTSSSKVLPSLC